MKIQIILSALLILCFSACNQSLTSIISKAEAGQAIIQYPDGKFSEPMSTRAGFEALKDNEKLYLSPGRVELTEPIEVENIDNIQIIGNKTALVAKVDMPVITFRAIEGIKMSGLLVVHEIGEWCAQNCVEFYKAEDLDIQNCKFDGSGYFGLALTGVNRAKMNNNEFFNCEYGLAAWNCTELTVTNNGFSGNRGEDIMVNNEAQFSNDFKADNTFEK